MNRPRADCPRLADRCRGGRVLPDEMISRRLPGAEISRGFEGLEQGQVARAVVVSGR